MYNTCFESRESAKQAFDFASSAGSTLLTTGSAQMAMSSGLSAVGKESIHLANYATEMAIEVVKDQVVYGGMEYAADLVIKDEQNRSYYPTFLLYVLTDKGLK